MLFFTPILRDSIFEICFEHTSMINFKFIDVEIILIINSMGTTAKEKLISIFGQNMLKHQKSSN